MNSSDFRAITRDGRLKQDPTVAPDGHSLIYALQETPALLRLMRLDLRTGRIEPLHPAANTSEYELSYAADGSAYAFVQNRGNLSLSLVIRDANTKQDYAFTPGGGFAGLRRPAFHPDGKRIALSVPMPNGGQSIITVNRRGEDRQPLIEGAINTSPAWSPDGKSLALISSRSGTLELYLWDATTKALTLLKTPVGLKQRPTWSPDGKWIAFTINREGIYRIARIRPDGKDFAILTQESERDDYPCFLPNQPALLYVRLLRGRTDIVQLPL
ncbi:TolB family protein [Tuwongella immobilis]|uniref:Uncharacterized protein n=1 Tax=Tuwongella immobilis TaxID=692036 RepID=A0A6C2YJE3_9BACT|nr:PD40 domain-containing protein [Tuwongella immobilis]VIP01536.1 Periplasmic component of the Tol biopolymer transport system OS=Singulisphaera acidiphila (strain ATCC BAA-1392 / DSM 18658 / VKM B-2454 / MOB10) GN=Sinac_7127 PE=4 SV=1: PD40: PD40 [Tuwongella immobilis]VTR98700.1 Periplasmic component of the Tol biopolymer transport system OS=Singulisphaera acidiphila (strain ATCC BAA-1392 / DSM 18658 / VKM B-2454 / MOB10) GN=Sinac_7127 PE=4 SV=1: PD40: PD40 [Tuwongella immobilis]